MFATLRGFAETGSASAGAGKIAELGLRWGSDTSGAARVGAALRATMSTWDEEYGERRKRQVTRSSIQNDVLLTGFDAVAFHPRKGELSRVHGHIQMMRIT